MAQYASLQMSQPREYPVSGPTAQGRGLQSEHGVFTLGTQSGGALNAGDTVQMFRLHRNFFVKNGFLKWDTAMAGVTLSLGDAANPTRYFNAVSAAAVGSTNAIADSGRDYLNVPHRLPVILTINGATTTTTGTITAELNGTIENPS